MKRLAASATYTAASFFAALAVVVLMIRTTDISEQAKFFYFQAIFYVLNTVISQSLTLLTFRNIPARMVGFGADATALVLVFSILQISGGLQFSLVDQLCYAVATVLLYRGAAMLISVQFVSRNSLLFLWVPLAALVARITTAWLFSGYGPAQMFLVNGIACFAVPAIVLRNGLLRQHEETAQAPKGKGPATGGIFLFFFIGAMTFQWERILYGLQENIENLVTTGYVMTVVLPPLSSLFATLYRGNARDIFAEQEAAVQRKRFMRIGGTFAAGAVVYLVLLLAFWPFAMQLLGAEIIPDMRLGILLGAAVILDRLANLLVFLRLDNAAYHRAALTKGFLLTIGCGIAANFAFTLPIMNYAIFLLITLSYFYVIVVGRG